MSAWIIEEGSGQLYSFITVTTTNGNKAFFGPFKNNTAAREWGAWMLSPLELSWSVDEMRSP